MNDIGPRALRDLANGDSSAAPSNPKDAVGVTKLPLHLVPATATALASLAHLDGGLKYGFWNWRATGVKASVYVAALKRHIDAWENGEELDPDSGVHHLGHAHATLNVLIDAMAIGKLTDDRPPRAPIREWFSGLTTNVARLIEKHKDRSPRHYTINDSEVP